jgi:acetoacetyl-CoA synthetase
MAFAIAKDASALGDAAARLKLEGEVMKVVDSQLGAVARPARVLFVSALPKTRSGKLLRRAIQAVCEKRDPGDLTTMDDPLALKQIQDVLGQRLVYPINGNLAFVQALVDQYAGDAALISLRTICSTGSPLAPEGFDWVYQSVKSDVHLASISGGTDLCGCFVGGDPTKPVYRGEIQSPMLGMAVDVVDEQLRSLHDNPLTPGELVCRQPFPSMPIGFWNDGNVGFPVQSQPGPKFLSAYFERLNGMWAQGDFASWTSHGGMIIHGRSDTTLNPGGVRIGTAEIYRVVEQHADVVESLVFGQDWDNDVRIVLLVRLAENASLSAELVADLKQRIRIACTPRHVPALVVQVHDLPRTRSNQLVELALADAVNGRPVRNSEAIANPECISVIAAMDELRR